MNAPARITGSGEPIVFLHGALVDGRLWRHVVPLLDDAHRCVVLDLPLGAHTTPAPAGTDFTLPGLARLVTEQLEQHDLDGVTLVGNDTGGAIAQWVAANHPERIKRLVLTNCDMFEHFFPTLFKPLQLAAKAPKLAYPLLQPLRLGPVRRLPVAFGWLTKRPDTAIEADWVRPFFSDPAIRRDAFSLLGGVDKRYTLEVAEALRGFDKPTLMAWGPDDRVFPISDAEKLAARMPDARVERIEDAYAFVAQDNPQRTAQVIRDFVAATR